MDVAIMRGRAWSLATAGHNRDLLFDYLDEVLAYKVAGAEWSEKFAMGIWDGMGRLHNRPRGKNAVRFPTGMIDRVRARLTAGKHPHAIGELTHLPPRTVLGRWTGHPLREYQRTAVDKFLRAYDIATVDPGMPPGGILRLPVRSGKTTVAARAIHEMGQPALFVVPSNLLLRQTIDSFRASLAGVTIGQFGDGAKEVDADVIVATVQSIAASTTSRVFNGLRRRFTLPDEAHHQGGDADTWRKAMMLLDAPVTLALTATFDFEEPSDSEEATKSIWLRGMAGPVLYTVTTDELIQMGYLVKPTVVWVEYDTPKIKGRMAPQTLYRQGIVDNEARNKAIVDVAVKAAESGHRVLVDAAQTGHTRILNKMLKARLGARVGMIIGPTADAMKTKLLAAFVDGRVTVLVGTVLGEGIDIPCLDVVVNAEGGTGYIPTMQRFRCMTPAPGKKDAFMYDFVDDHHPSLFDATISRSKIYAANKTFGHRVEVAK